jgi:hypothetical protein
MKNREDVERRRKKKNKEEAVVDCCPPKRDKGKKEKERKRKGKRIREKIGKITEMLLNFNSFICQLLFNPHIKSSYILPHTLNPLFFNYTNIITKNLLLIQSI